MFDKLINVNLVGHSKSNVDIEVLPRNFEIILLHRDTTKQCSFHFGAQMSLAPSPAKKPGFGGVAAAGRGRGNPL